MEHSIPTLKKNKIRAFQLAYCQKSYGQKLTNIKKNLRKTISMVTSPDSCEDCKGLFLFLSLDFLLKFLFQALKISFILTPELFPLKYRGVII